MKVEIEDGRLIVTPITEEDSRIIQTSPSGLSGRRYPAGEKGLRKRLLTRTLSQTFS